jgi:hypothetical protein
MKKSTSTSTPNSQTTAAMTKSDMLVGKWKFTDTHEKEDMDEAGMKMLKSFFGSLKLSFSEDRTYTAFIMGKDDGGNWKLNDSEDKVLMTSNNSGENMEMTVLELSADKLIIKLEKAAFVLKKS